MESGNPILPPDSPPPESLAPGVSGHSSLAQRSVRSVTWNVLARFIKLPAGLLLSVILARNLAVEDFGIVAGIEAFLSLLVVFFDFGMVGAYFHRSAETEDEQRATGVLFTLRILFSLVFWALTLLIAVIFLSGVRQMVFLVWGGVLALMRVVDVPRLLLMRRVEHKRLAFFDVVVSIVVLLVSSWIAITSHSIWALLIYPIITLALSLVFFYLWRPVWRPRWLWDPLAMRYYLNFGRRLAPGNVLSVALEHIDDLWTNLFLGDLALGFYSRAYRFASYPRLALAEPLNVVTSATYAELKHDRPRRSQAFFRVNALLVRSGFLLGGWFAVAAPELVVIFLGEQWLPMVLPFRLMLVFTLLEPIKTTVGSLLVAVGKPEQVSMVRFVQLLVMVGGLFGLGFALDIAGVALAVDLMLLVGMGLLFYLVRPYVDVSFRGLFLAPAVGLFIGSAFSWASEYFASSAGSDWLLLVLKTLGFGLGYAGVLALAEWRLLRQLFEEVLRLQGLTGRSARKEADAPSKKV